MPVYEYKCNKCGREFEYQQRMSDPDKTTCENCGGDLERLISRTAFTLKGGGWYKDLYSSSKPESTATSSDTKSESKPETKTESKPDSAAPAAPSSTPSSSGSSSSGGSSTGGGGTT